MGEGPEIPAARLLSESWAQPAAMADDPERVVGYGLVWPADVLRALGHQSIG